MRKTRIVAILMFVSALAGFAFGQDDWMPALYKLEISPPHPNSSQAITMTLRGVWRDGCVPTGSAVSVQGNDILWDIFLAPMNMVCVQVISDWHQTRTLGPLAPGLYHVKIRAIRSDGFASPYFVKGSFQVNPVPTTTVYRFLDEQSLLIISGGIMGMMITSPVEGTFQLTVDQVAGTARFDSVNASYLGLDPMEPGDLGRLFNMTELAGNRVNAGEFDFTGHTTPPLSFDVNLHLTLKGDLVHLTGGFPPPGTCCDFIFYELDAWAQAVRPPCNYRLAGDLNDDCRVDLADLAILAANWLYDCTLYPDNPRCIAK